MRIEARDNNPIHWSRVSGLIFVICVSVSASYFLQPFVSNSEGFVDVVVTIFSILAGFLIAVITIVADPIMKRAKRPEQIKLMENSIEAKLIRHKALFYCYLMTLGAAMAMMLLPPKEIILTLWMERIFIGLAVFVFLASFALPNTLIRIQMDRIKADYEEKSN